MKSRLRAFVNYMQPEDVWAVIEDYRGFENSGVIGGGPLRTWTAGYFGKGKDNVSNMTEFANACYRRVVDEFIETTR